MSEFLFFTLDQNEARPSFRSVTTNSILRSPTFLRIVGEHFQIQRMLDSATKWKKRTLLTMGYPHPFQTRAARSDPRPLDLGTRVKVLLNVI